VVKLGGSHVDSRDLEAWLDIIAGYGGNVVVVPGGGPFADAVRKAQTKMRFDDAAAHHMALLAMEQFGRALVALRAGCRMASSVAAIRQVLRDRGVPIWSPAAMVLRTPEIPARWDVTSDSLAAWLAGHIGASRLLMIKRGVLRDSAVTAAELVARKIVDDAFPQFLAASGVPAAVVSSSAHSAAAAALRGPTMPGVPINLHARQARRLLSRPWPSSRRRAGDGR
jgi:5-(aminomethyl)-3-furanmethanol phosphate kinase